MRWFKIRRFERGLLFRDRDFVGLLEPGRHFFFDPLFRIRVDIVSVREVRFTHPDSEVIAKSGALGAEAAVVDLKDHQRAVIWVDGRIEAVLGPDVHVLWTGFHDVKVEVFDARKV